MSTFKPGDYVEGIEMIGNPAKERIMRGYVDKVHEDYLDIQADDGFNGMRGTSIKIESAHICSKIDDWQRALKREIPVGSIVKHFKNKLYKILGYANHADGGRVVIYMALYGEYKVYVREYSEFMSLVDNKKYPDVAQTYRFEEVKCNGGDV